MTLENIILLQNSIAHAWKTNYARRPISFQIFMAQSQCRRSVGDKFWPGVVVENKESLNNRSNNPNKSGSVTLSEIFERILTRFCRKIMG